MQKDWALIRLPDRLCLFEEKAAGFMQSLVRFAEGMHKSLLPPVKGVLILQTSPADDRSATWLRELENSALFRDLVGRLDSWRWLLSLIRNSPVPWAYMTRYDCRGSAFELALSCQRRYFFATEARVGFPEIRVGSFPPGGVLESLSKRTGRTRERWQSHPELSAASALEDGLVQFCSETAAWQPVAERLFRELLVVSPRAGVRDAQRKKRRADYFDISASIDSRQAAYEQLEQVWRQEQSRSRKYPSAWDYCWQLVKERSKLKDPQDLGRLVAHIAAGHFLTPGYQAWIATYLLSCEATAPTTRRAEADAPIVVDLSHAAPPTSVLIRLLRRQARLIFVSPEAKPLAAAVNLLFNRLERDLTTPKATALWTKFVTWYQGEADNVTHPILRWMVDDRFQIVAKGETVTFLRLEGNSSAAKPGLLEWDGATPEERLSDGIRVLADLAAEGVIRTSEAAAGLPLSVYVRSLFFEEMLRICRHVEGDLAKVTEALREDGWAFAGDDEAWDRFLKTRYDAYSFDAELRGLGAQPIDRANLEIGTWKHARAVAKRQAVADRPWNKTAISQHMALFLGLIAGFVAGGRGLAAHPNADHLTSVALGFPAVYGTPRSFLEHRGRRRVEVYARDHWPKFPLTTAWGDELGSVSNISVIPVSPAAQT